MRKPPSRTPFVCGILAFGSLIWEPGKLAELERVGEMLCMTPWPVEFARSSRKRNWAPTLVRVEEGVPVRAHVIFYSNDCDTVRNLLAEREGINLAKYADDIQECQVAGVRAARVWYTALRPNIDDLRPSCLARLAIASVRSCPTGNGILYLRKCLGFGVRTALCEAYSAEILRISLSQVTCGG